MRPAQTRVHLLPSERSFAREFRSGVSLHSHTEHSREYLGGLPEYLGQMPVVSQFVRWEIEAYRGRHGGEAPDFSKAYWRGPVSAQLAYQLEAQQIEEMGLPAMVSLTDHDNLDAGLFLRAQGPDFDLPLSAEWTVPHANVFFHVGVHNIPAQYVTGFMERMSDYTVAPQPLALGPLFEDLAACPNILIVLNHPLWNMAGIDTNEFDQAVQDFLRLFGSYIHAIEINGLRSWEENLGAVSLAQRSNHAVVSGGDRHGFEPNATINLTRATSFADFVHEIREERISDIAMMPQYREPLVLRHLGTAWDAVRQHPQLPGHKHWTARVFVVCHDGVERPLSQVWERGAPAWIGPCLKIVGLLANPTLRVPFRLPYPVARSVAL